ncbi:hypothetical protein CVH10_04855 [Halomonas sp. ND22Bw]|uniref:Uncharacterized protein n=1 Tax=Halomonas salina TaxID=42565 RepID=A0ABR4WRP8_9GAMM|nr:hypothetical protein [Halomonas salina]KGE77397.1 hypothetical protein FP66_10390 [Halomonas salina]PSJ23212.1 hypothetical protein CVH10_04855 [Halomonas sp. ND22Bw]
MMIVDLIDGDDFRDRLVALDIHVPEDASPETCAHLARLKHDEVGVPGLEALVRELMAQADVMLPAVREAIEQHLMELPSGDGESA